MKMEKENMSPHYYNKKKTMYVDYMETKLKRYGLQDGGSLILNIYQRSGRRNNSWE